MKTEDVERFIRPVPAPNAVVPRVSPPSEAEVARRRSLFDQAMRLRAEIGPVGIAADELVRQGRAEEEAPDA